MLLDEPSPLDGARARVTGWSCWISKYDDQQIWILSILARQDMKTYAIDHNTGIVQNYKS